MKKWHKETNTISESDINELSNKKWLERISIWDSFLDKTTNEFKMYYKEECTLINILNRTINPKVLAEDKKDIVKKVLRGELSKEHLFGYTQTTFNRDSETGKMRRLGINKRTYTNLVQIDLDLKNEPDCTDEYVNSIQYDLFTLTELSKHILFCGKSISRKGLYAFILIDTDDKQRVEYVIHKIYENLQRVFNFKNPTKTLDTSVKDIFTRVRFYSPDKDVIVNDDVVAIDTTNIVLNTITKTYSKPATNISITIQNDIIKKMYHRHLKKYISNTNYESGFDNSYRDFTTACLGLGVDRITLEQFTKAEYSNLYNSEKRMNYLNKLMQVLNNAENFINRK